MGSCLYLKISNICELTRKVIFGAAITRNITYNRPLFFNVTPISWAEPMKKKKRLDPNLSRAKEDRKRRRIEKEMRRLVKNVLQPKPLIEMEVPVEVKNTLNIRFRPLVELSSEETEHRVETFQEWSVFKKVQFESDIKMMKSILLAKQNALEALRDESEELYQEAIQLDNFLIPFTCKGPSLTPMSESFDPLDGEINDITRTWEL